MERRSAEPIDEHLLHQLLGEDPSAPTVLPDEAADPVEGGEPDEYGVRVAWQSEDELLEAAEFLVATRAQHEARLRAQHDIDLLREHDQAVHPR